MEKVLQVVHRYVWGVPMLLLIIGIGLLLTIRTKFAQFRLFPRALRKFWQCFRARDDAGNGVSSYQALCTALGATVGTGNLAGVAGAIAIGGPGAVFWMWICGLLGMVTKFAEAVLSVYYREKNAAGEWVGGPMYAIKNGLSKKYRFLAVLYCFFGVVAAFGVGNATQINTVIASVNSAASYFGIEATRSGNILMGIGLAVLVGAMLFGGAKRIGSAAEALIPLASVLYILLGFGVLVLRSEAIPYAFRAIVTGAFSPRAVTGGTVGSAVLALRTGSSRGVFTNEAGMGTAGIVHASAEVSHPVEQGLMGIIEVFLDTIVICTVTALVILCSGTPIYYGTDCGITLTIDAFSTVYGNWVSIVISASVCCFAFATVLGWGLYGMRCAQFLFGVRIWRLFAGIQIVTVILGAALNTSTVWLLAETINGLMAIPNLLALCLLIRKVEVQVQDYCKKKQPASKEAG